MMSKGKTKSPHRCVLCKYWTEDGICVNRSIVGDGKVSGVWRFPFDGEDCKKFTIKVEDKKKEPEEVKPYDKTDNEDGFWADFMARFGKQTKSPGS